MNLQERYNLLMKAGAKGKFFTAKFIKRSDGQPCAMNCRLGVKKHLKGGMKAYDDREHNLVTVYDMVAKGYRCIPLETVFEVNGVRVE